MYDDDPLPIDKTYQYMIENPIDWGNGSAYKKLKEQGIE